MSTPVDLHAYQRDFAAWLRRPQGAAPMALAGQRTDLYAELLRNNIEGLLARSFPVLQQCLGASAWRALVGDFFAEHPARTPYFPRLPAEFVDYLARGRGAREGDPGFLAELAHYEWMEVALAIAEEVAIPRGPGLHLAPHAWPFSYVWPVQCIGPEAQPTDPPAEPSHLLLYRDVRGQVHFLQLTAATARLLGWLAQYPGCSFEALVGGLAGALGASPQGLRPGVEATLVAFGARGIVLLPEGEPRG